ncbi:MAG: hypothetical protein AAGU27_09545 [Dehalobacterium sp.]
MTTEITTPERNIERYNRFSLNIDGFMRPSLFFVHAPLWLKQAYIDTTWIFGGINGA